MLFVEFRGLDTLSPLKRFTDIHDKLYRPIAIQTSDPKSLWKLAGVWSIFVVHPTWDDETSSPTFFFFCWDVLKASTGKNGLTVFNSTGTSCSRVGEDGLVVCYTWWIGELSIPCRWPDPNPNRQLPWLWFVDLSMNRLQSREAVQETQDYINHVYWRKNLWIYDSERK